MASQTRTILPPELLEFVQEWKAKPGNLIMIMHRIQQHYGYIPEAVADELTRIANIPAAKIFGVATFYNFFNLTPPGKHRIAVCMGTACYLKGAQAVGEAIQSQLNVRVHEVTADKRFSLLEVRCVGCCGLAPAVMVDDDLHGKVTPEDVRGIIKKYQEAD